jgi:tetraacyldisaccharide 4'-kinase
MKLVPGKLHNLVDPQKTRRLESWRHKSVHAVAAIGNPQRFFNTLKDVGINVFPQEFPDHYQYKVQDINFPDVLPVVMTEKDAVKCTRFNDDKLWYLPIETQLPASFTKALLTLIKEKR